LSAELLARSQETLAHGLGRELQHARDGVVRQALDRAQDQHLARVHAQVGERALQLTLELARRGQLERRARICRRALRSTNAQRK
jgi:hypothetical protein